MQRHKAVRSTWFYHFLTDPILSLDYARRGKALLVLSVQLFENCFAVIHGEKLAPSKNSLFYLVWAELIDNLLTLVRCRNFDYSSAFFAWGPCFPLIKLEIKLLIAPLVGNTLLGNCRFAQKLLSL